MAHEFESGFFVREPAWHGLGTVVDTAPTSADALRLAGLDWKVEQMPVFVCNSEVPTYKANVRSTDHATLGIVREKYQIIQNTDAFEFTDKLLGAGVQYETAGSLRGGKTIWLLAKMETAKILGDEIAPYMCFTNTHDGSSPVRVCMTDVRVVCNNTLSLALSKAPRIWSARHLGDIRGKALSASETLKLANQYNNALNDFAEDMAKEKLSDTQKTQIIDNLFPISDTMTQRQQNSMKDTKDEFMVCMLAPDLANFINTRWQIVQAATDFVSHRTPKRKTASYQENVWSSLINGNVFLDKTMELVTTI